MASNHTMTLPPLSEFLPTGQGHENDIAHSVLVCAPSALSKMMGSLHPAGALYEKPVNTQLALKAHATFVDIMREQGITVHDVRDILTDRVSWSVGDRVSLEKLASNCLTYLFDTSKPSSSDDDIDSESEDDGKLQEKLSFSDAEAYYISDKYKQSVIEHMDEQQLVDIIFTNPTVTVTPSTRDTGFNASYKFEPQSNIIFVRDQQITTRRGIVMTRLRSPQRAREVDIMLFCIRKLGLSVIGRVPAPGHLEGGDFFPAGDHLCLLGIGPRSNWAAAKYLLDNDLFGTETVAIVKDEFEQRQERMHLDTVFNIVSSNCCIMLQDMMGEDSPTKRLVDEYIYRNSKDKESHEYTFAPRIGKYLLHRSDIEFSKYMREKEYEIIPVSGKEQLNYGCNALNLGNSHIISIESNVARRIACSPHFHGTVQYLDFSGVTCMYGGVHCATQVVLRNPLKPIKRVNGETKASE